MFYFRAKYPCGILRVVGKLRSVHHFSLARGSLNSDAHFPRPFFVWLPRCWVPLEPLNDSLSGEAGAGPCGNARASWGALAAAVLRPCPCIDLPLSVISGQRAVQPSPGQCSDAAAFTPNCGSSQRMSTCTRQPGARPYMRWPTAATAALPTRQSNFTLLCAGWGGRLPPARCAACGGPGSLGVQVPRCLSLRPPLPAALGPCSRALRMQAGRSCSAAAACFLAWRSAWRGSLRPPRKQLPAGAAPARRGARCFFSAPATTPSQFCTLHAGTALRGPVASSQPFLGSAAPHQPAAGFPGNLFSGAPQAGCITARCFPAPRFFPRPARQRCCCAPARLFCCCLLLPAPRAGPPWRASCFCCLRRCCCCCWRLRAQGPPLPPGSSPLARTT